MLTRIGDFINPPQSKGESTDKVERPDHKNRKGGQQKDEAPAQENDDTFFSVEAIRALLKQENAAGSEVMDQLDLLQKNGIASIAIRNEQSITAAIADAAARLNK